MNEAAVDFLLSPDGFDSGSDHVGEEAIGPKEGHEHDMVRKNQEAIANCASSYFGLIVDR